MKLLYGADQGVSDWVSKEMYGVPGLFEDSKAIGVVDGKRFLAGVVYDNLRIRPDGTPYMMEMSVASVDKRWATKGNLRAFFTYPFIQLGLERVYTHCSSKDERLVRFNQRLGFSTEGYHRMAFPDGGDSISFGMLKSECRWIR